MSLHPNETKSSKLALLMLTSRGDGMRGGNLHPGQACVMPEFAKDFFPSANEASVFLRLRTQYTWSFIEQLTIGEDAVATCDSVMIAAAAALGRRKEVIHKVYRQTDMQASKQAGKHADRQID